jgi:hypothetical protein
MKRPGLMTLGELQRFTWRTRHDISNGYVRIPKGTQVTITHKRNGVTIEGTRCQCCGVRVLCRKVPLSDLEMLRCPDCGSAEHVLHPEGQAVP